MFYFIFSPPLTLALHTKGDFMLFPTVAIRDPETGGPRTITTSQTADLSEPLANAFSAIRLVEDT